MFSNPHPSILYHKDCASKAGMSWCQQSVFPRLASQTSSITSRHCRALCAWMQSACSWQFSTVCRLVVKQQYVPKKDWKEARGRTYFSYSCCRNLSFSTLHISRKQDLKLLGRFATIVLKRADFNNVKYWKSLIFSEANVHNSLWRMQWEGRGNV